MCDHCSCCSGSYALIIFPCNSVPCLCPQHQTCSVTLPRASCLAVRRFCPPFCLRCARWQLCQAAGTQLPKGIANKSPTNWTDEWPKIKLLKPAPLWLYVSGSAFSQVVTKNHERSCHCTSGNCKLRSPCSSLLWAEQIFLSSITIPY